MILHEQNRLIDDLIRENPDATIKDYWKAINGKRDKKLTLLIFESAMNINKVKKVGKAERKYYQSFHIRR